MTKDEKQNIKLEKVDDKTAYENLLIKYAELEKELEQEKKLNAEIKARFVKCNTCTDEMKSKCLMFSENLCEGERCEELVDLMALVNKSDLQKENEQLKEQIEKMKEEHKQEILDLVLSNSSERAELEKENAKLKEQLEICETNADTYYDELTKLQEQLVKSTQIGLTCSNCKWSQYDEDEMCYCCSNKDKWELKLRR